MKLLNLYKFILSLLLILCFYQFIKINELSNQNQLLIKEADSLYSELDTLLKIFIEYEIPSSNSVVAQKMPTEDWNTALKWFCALLGVVAFTGLAVLAFRNLPGGVGPSSCGLVPENFPNINTTVSSDVLSDTVTSTSSTVSTVENLTQISSELTARSLDVLVQYPWLVEITVRHNVYFTAIISDPATVEAVKLKLKMLGLIA